MVELKNIVVKRSDLKFRVSSCKYGTSPSIAQSIWIGQHTCVGEEEEILDDCPYDEEKASQGIINNQLKGDRGHYSVLNQAFVKFHISGFPHSTMTQIVRHHEAFPLVQSGRYTGQRFIDVADEKRSIDSVFFVRPPGVYRDRDGRSIEWTEERIKKRSHFLMERCHQYKQDFDDGMPLEMAREFMPYCFRQNFVMSGTLKEWWHILDQRSKADAEWEIRVLAEMVNEVLMQLCPTLQQWYKENRYGKARLAP